MRRILTALPLLFTTAAIATAPAIAGHGLFCVDENDQVEVSIQLAGGVGFGVLSADIRLQTRVWATDFDTLPYYIAAYDAERILVAQAGTIGELAVVDFSDEDALRIVAELRYFVVQEGFEPVIAGTLRIGGVRAWAVKCSFG